MARVEPAFRLLVLFPPTAPGALRLAMRHRAGAGCAANRKKSAIMQRVIGNVVGVYESNYSVARPVEQRVHFDYPMLWIDYGVRHTCARGGLVGAQSGDPGRGAGKCATE